jgi:hypothetical protein
VEGLSYALCISRRMVTVGLSEPETLPLLASPSLPLFPERLALFPEHLALFGFGQPAAAFSLAVFAGDSAPSSVFHP